MAVKQTSPRFFNRKYIYIYIFIWGPFFPFAFLLVYWSRIPIFDQWRLLVLARDGFGRILSPKTKARTVLMSDYTTLPGTFCSEIPLNSFRGYLVGNRDLGSCNVEYSNSPVEGSIAVTSTLKF